MPEHSKDSWNQYHSEREQLQQQVDSRLRTAMSKLVGNPDHADLLFVTKDGKKLSAHRSILEQRAPGFYKRYVHSALNKKPANPATSASAAPKVTQIVLSDIDASALRFFVESIYTEDEVPEDVHDTPRQPARGPSPDQPPPDDDGGAPDPPPDSTSRGSKPVSVRGKPKPSTSTSSNRSASRGRKTGKLPTGRAAKITKPVDNKSSEPPEEDENGKSASSDQEASENISGSKNTISPSETETSTDGQKQILETTETEKDVRMEHTKIDSAEKESSQAINTQQPTDTQMAMKQATPDPMVHPPGHFSCQVDENVIESEFEEQRAKQPTIMTSFRELALVSPFLSSNSVNHIEADNESMTNSWVEPVIKRDMCILNQIIACQAIPEEIAAQTELDSGELSPDSFTTEAPRTCEMGVGTDDVNESMTHSIDQSVYDQKYPVGDSIMSPEDVLLLEQIQSVSEQPSLAQTPIGHENYSLQADLAARLEREQSSQPQEAPRLIHFNDLPAYNKSIDSSMVNEPLRPPSSQAVTNEPQNMTRPAQRGIFPIFIEFGTKRAVVKPMISPAKPNENHDLSADDESLPPNCADQSIGAGMNPGFRRRLSVASLRSLDSVDMSPSLDNQSCTGNFPPDDQTACSTLANDLLQMYLEQNNVDLTLQAKDGKLGCHRSILSVRSSYFASVLGKEWRSSKSSTYDLTSYNRASLDYTLCFVYGGVSTVPDSLNIWELMSIADMFQLEDMKLVLALHFKAKQCHYFHRPCAGCVPAALEAMPRLHSFGLKQALDQCMCWQAKYFSRIWKSRAFAQMNVNWQQKCYWAVVENMDVENVINTLLGCEKLQVTLPRVTKGGVSTESASTFISQLLDATIEFMAANFDMIITTESFLNQGRGMALNVSLLEDVLPSVVHALSADTGCRVLVRLYELLVFLTSVQHSNSNLTSLEPNWNERFSMLIRRLYELCDTHLIHSAAAVTKCESWSLLTQQMQQRITETGIFVEMRQPRAPPPRLSSLTRSYRRSASAGMSHVGGNSGTWERGRSLTRPSPPGTIHESSEPDLTSAIRKQSEPFMTDKANEKSEPAVKSKSAKGSPSVQSPDKAAQASKPTATKQERPKTLKTTSASANPKSPKKVEATERVASSERTAPPSPSTTIVLEKHEQSPKKSFSAQVTKPTKPTNAVEPTTSVVRRKKSVVADDKPNTPEKSVTTRKGSGPKEPLKAATTKSPPVRTPVTKVATRKPAPTTTSKFVKDDKKDTKASDEKSQTTGTKPAGATDTKTSVSSSATLKTKDPANVTDNAKATQKASVEPKVNSSVKRTIIPPKTTSKIQKVTPVQQKKTT